MLFSNLHSVAQRLQKGCIEATMSHFPQEQLLVPKVSLKDLVDQLWDDIRWRVRIALKPGFDLMVAGLTEGTFYQANGATMILMKVIATKSVVNTLHAAIATWDGLVEDSIHRAHADALFAHGAKVAQPEVLVFTADWQILDVGVDGVNAQTRPFIGGNEQAMIAGGP
jgi:hypothetical protein